VYGIDLPSAQELIAHGRTVDEVSAKLGCDWLFYNDVEVRARARVCIRAWACARVCMRVLADVGVWLCVCVWTWAWAWAWCAMRAKT
jgi:glutamine phosphoribosylpyrophosphate amidotransferase